ncbi:MAG: hypothetical protein K0S68_1, partial [Candidatus Saccharibacteria bacterium]|nr:hypothetical protein [Candidatus Saccharibacteria bacterium]
MLPTHDIDVGWKTTVSNVTLPLSRDIVRQASRLVVQAANAFTTEHTAAMRLLGVPSGIWRLDCTLVDQDGQGVTLYQPSEDAFYPPAGTVQMYEAEDRPLGLGLLTAMSPDFDARLELLRRSWPPLRVVVHPGLENDDHVWLGRDRVHHGLEALPADGFVIVRADPGLREYHPLSFRGWSTVITEGKKAYGDRMKIWRLVHRVEDLPRTHLP